jgi:hypothetical protein
MVCKKHFVFVPLYKEFKIASEALFVTEYAFKLLKGFGVIVRSSRLIRGQDAARMHYNGSVVWLGAVCVGVGEFFASPGRWREVVLSR